MYKKDKFKMTIIFIVVFISTFFLGVDFENIVSECISIVVFTLFLYAICLKSLIGSPLLQQLYKNIDTKIPEKTQLGVFKQYIIMGIRTAIITIVLACLKKIKITNKILILLSDNLKHLNIQQFLSSLCFSFFSLNFVFMLFIFLFTINKQVQ